MTIMWMAVTGYLSLLLGVVLQTFQGRAPLDLSLPAAGLLLMSAVLGVLAVLGFRSAVQDGPAQS